MSMLPADSHRRLEWKPPENNNFMVRDGEGKPFRCRCGANVLHKEWDAKYGEIYVCNGCGTAYLAESM